jgi:hypothetical protein
MKNILLIGAMLCLSVGLSAQNEALACNNKVGAAKAACIQDNTPPPFTFQTTMLDGTVIKSHEVKMLDTATVMLVIYNRKNGELIRHEILVGIGTIKSVKSI